MRRLALGEGGRAEIAPAAQPFLLHFAEPAPSVASDRPPEPFDLRRLLASLVPTLAGDAAAAPFVLLLAYGRNRDATLLERALVSRGTPCLLLGADGIPSDALFSCRLESGGTADGRLAVDGHDAPMGSLRSVWFGLPTWGAAVHALPVEPVRRFAALEWLDALQGWWRMCGTTFVNPPDANIFAGNKLTALRHAAAAGLTIPETLVTNDRSDAMAFCAQHGRVLAKTLSSHYVELDGRRHSLFSRLVEPGDLSTFGSPDLAPCILQPYAEKRLDVRVTVAGEAVLSAEIHSQEDERARVDVRRGAGRVPFGIHQLPDEVAEGCRSLVAGLGLRYAALDLILTPEGEYVYLDLNPRGGWWFVEERTGLPITDTVAALLSEPPS